MHALARCSLALAVAVAIGAPAVALAATPSAQKKVVKSAEPAKPIGTVVEYTELEHHVGDTIVVETTFDTVRRGKLIRYTNPGLTLQLGPEHGSIELSVPRETVRNVSVMAADPAATAPAQDGQGTGSAKKN